LLKPLKKSKIVFRSFPNAIQTPESEHMDFKNLPLILIPSFLTPILSRMFRTVFRAFFFSCIPLITAFNVALLIRALLDGLALGALEPTLGTARGDFEPRLCTKPGDFEPTLGTAPGDLGFTLGTLDFTLGTLDFTLGTLISSWLGPMTSIL
jgi:hypothetical protein